MIIDTSGKLSLMVQYFWKFLMFLASALALAIGISGKLTVFFNYRHVYCNLV